MESNGDSVMVSDNKQGVDRVKKERNRYAFFMESSSIEYEVQRNCDLTEVGYWLDNKAYGIAMPFSWVWITSEQPASNVINLIIVDAPHRTAVSMAVLKLSESGALMQLKNKWWSVSDDKKCKVSEHSCARIGIIYYTGL